MTGDELTEWDRKHDALRNSLPDGWFDVFTKRKERSWDELMAMCPFHALRLNPWHEEVDAYDLHKLEHCVWLLGHTVNMWDFTLIYETIDSYDNKYVSHYRNASGISSRIAGVIFNDDTTLMLFKLTFSELLYTN